MTWTGCLRQRLYATAGLFYLTVVADKAPPIVRHERTWGGYAMYNIYETRDGKYIVLGASEMHFAEAVLSKLGRTDLLPLCSPPPGPNQDPVRAFFTETFSIETQKYWIDWFSDVDAAFG